MFAEITVSQTRFPMNLTVLLPLQIREGKKHVHIHIRLASSYLTKLIFSLSPNVFHL